MASSFGSRSNEFALNKQQSTHIRGPVKTGCGNQLIQQGEARHFREDPAINYTGGSPNERRIAKLFSRPQGRLSGATRFCSDELACDSKNQLCGRGRAFPSHSAGEAARTLRSTTIWRLEGEVMGTLGDTFRALHQ